MYNTHASKREGEREKEKKERERERESERGRWRLYASQGWLRNLMNKVHTTARARPG